MKVIQKMVVVVCVAAVLCSGAFADVIENDVPFPDVAPDAPYAEAVAELYQLGIMTGDNNGNFNPDSTISRAEAATVICRLMGMEDEAKNATGSAFLDVPSTHWAVGYVAKAAELGIIDGYGNKQFGPEDPVTYDQFVKMLVAAWGYGSVAEESGGYPQGYLAVGDEYGFTTGISNDRYSAASRSVVAVLAYNATQVIQFSEG